LELSQYALNWGACLRPLKYEVGSEIHLLCCLVGRRRRRRRLTQVLYDEGEEKNEIFYGECHLLRLYSINSRCVKYGYGALME
jgi:hypothetical protein